MNFANPEYIMGGIGVRTDGWDRHGVKLNDLYEKYYGHRPIADDKIPHPDPKLIDENGNQVGMVPTGDALRMAYDKGLDW
jgi:hypothetical protein